MSHRPVGVGSFFSFSAGTATTSNSFSVQSSVLRVVAVSNAAHVAIGASPVATNEDYYIPAGGTVTLALTKASNRVAGIITGTTTIVKVPEGTQVPFVVGDYVTLTSGAQDYYNFTHQQVLSVDNTAGHDGYYQTRMVIDYNSSGIVTAFSASDASITRSNKVSAYGAGSGTLYFQQVQISGDA